MSFKDYLKENLIATSIDKNGNISFQPRKIRTEPIKDIEDAFQFAKNLTLPKRPVREGNIDYAIGEVIGLDKNNILSVLDVNDLKNRLMSYFKLNF